MKRWDVFDLLIGATKRGNVRFRLDKTWDADTFYFDDPLHINLNSRKVCVVFARLETTKLRMDIENGAGLETLRLQIESVRLEA